MNYANFGLGDNWNFSVELVYRMVADKEHQTEENITKIYLLRGIMDLVFALIILLMNNYIIFYHFRCFYIVKST